MTLLSTHSVPTAHTNDRCPWCGTVVSRAKFLEIEAKIREQERKKSQETEARLKEKFDRDLAVEKQAAMTQACAEAAKQLTGITVERDEAIGKAKEAAAREVNLRKQAEAETQKKLENVLKQAEIERQKDLQEQRLILERNGNNALLKQQAEFSRQREGFQKKVHELEQKIQQRSAHEIGEGAEVDVFEALRDAFQGDVISRIAKVDGGADIKHQVMYKGVVCGRIVYDSKNRQQWREAYVQKLRADQMAARAEHAILPTAVFRAGKKELSFESGVICVNPARVVELVTLLRNAMTRMHILGLSLKERADKLNKLYNYITSDMHIKRFQETARLADDILQIEVQEKKAHDNVWKNRGSLLLRLKNALRDEEVEISAIIESKHDAN
jgi:hypothetical protein